MSARRAVSDRQNREQLFLARQPRPSFDPAYVHIDSLPLYEAVMRICADLKITPDLSGCEAWLARAFRRETRAHAAQSVSRMPVVGREAKGDNRRCRSSGRSTCRLLPRRLTSRLQAGENIRGKFEKKSVVLVSVNLATVFLTAALDPGPQRIGPCRGDGHLGQGERQQLRHGSEL